MKIEIAFNEMETIAIPPTKIVAVCCDVSRMQLVGSETLFLLFDSVF